MGFPHLRKQTMVQRIHISPDPQLTRVNPDFLGTVVGLVCVLFLPSYYLNEEFDILRHLFTFGFLGFLFGSVIMYMRKRRVKRRR